MKIVFYKNEKDIKLEFVKTLKVKLEKLEVDIKESDNIFEEYEEETYDAYIIFNGEKEKIKEAIELKKNNNKKCLAIIEYNENTSEELYGITPYVHVKIKGINNKSLLENKILEIIEKQVEEMLIEEKESKTENQNEEYTIKSDGNLSNIHEKYLEKSEEIKELNKDKDIEKITKIKINTKSLIEDIIFSKICFEEQMEEIFVYDRILNKYVQVKKLEVESNKENKENKETEDKTNDKISKEKSTIQYEIVENKENNENILIKLTINNINELDENEEYILPKVSEDKNLYIIGNLPNWLFSSIILTYNCKNINIFTPGKGFTCVYSKKEDYIGKIEEQIHGIDINKCLENREKINEEVNEELEKEISTTNLPIVIENDNIITKIGNILKRVFDKKNQHSDKKEDYRKKKNHEIDSVKNRMYETLRIDREKCGNRIGLYSKENNAITSKEITNDNIEER